MLTNKDVGPKGDIPTLITPEISDLIREHSKYQFNLPVFDQFLIWCYTLGSASVNKRLLNILTAPNEIRWAYSFFENYNVRQYGLREIKFPFSMWNKYFENPDEYLLLSKGEALRIAETMIKEYIKNLERIIRNAPKNKEELTVYKVSSKYPELPEFLAYTQHIKVFQKPFNSTTYDPELNFAPFIPEAEFCCFFEILIPRNRNLLLIAPGLHAFPHECEILLPFGISLDIEKIDYHYLHYVPVEFQKFIPVQIRPYVIGEIFKVDYTCIENIEIKQIKYYHAKIL